MEIRYRAGPTAPSSRYIVCSAARSVDVFLLGFDHLGCRETIEDQPACNQFYSFHLTAIARCVRWFLSLSFCPRKIFLIYWQLVFLITFSNPDDKWKGNLVPNFLVFSQVPLIEKLLEPFAPFRCVSRLIHWRVIT